MSSFGQEQVGLHWRYRERLKCGWTKIFFNCLECKLFSSQITCAYFKSKLYLLLAAGEVLRNVTYMRSLFEDWTKLKMC